MLKNKIAVVLGRFQVPELHDGHKYILNYALENYKVVFVALGSSPVLDSTRNPLDFKTRDLMISDYCKTIGPTTFARCHEIKDHRSDEIWSKQIDEVILTDCGAFTKLFEGIDILGGKDNSLKYYSGKFTKVDVEIPNYLNEIHGKDLRNSVNYPLPTADFRKGVIYQIKSEYDKVYATVDIAIINKDEILLGRKPGETKFRFPGGFTDPKDESLEAAAKREAVEEVGNIALDNFKYVCSTNVSDWRYANERHKIITSLFMCQYIYGAPKASDDLEEVKWFNIENFDYKQLLVLEHIKLYKAILNTLKLK